MTFLEEIKSDVSGLFGGNWSERDGVVVPDTDFIKLAKDAVRISATVLYADLADSTGMISGMKRTFSAEVIKSFLRTSCKIITNHGGTITSFDGDRVMGVFVGDGKNTNAVKSALKINWVVKNIINPLMHEKYSTDFNVGHGVGVDNGDLFVARAGIRGANDLVWIGPSANYAAKLCSLREGNYVTWITSRVFENMNDEAKFDSQRRWMWEKMTWNTYNQTVYRSNYSWGI